MPSMSMDEFGGVTYGSQVLFTERPTADPFKVGRDVGAGDYLMLHVQHAQPHDRTYRVERVLARSDEHFPGVVLKDLHTGRRGVMKQASLNRVRPLRIYRPVVGREPVELRVGAIYQDIETGTVVRAVPGYEAGLVSLQMHYTNNYATLPYHLRVPFNAVSGQPKLVLRWAPEVGA